MEGKVYNCCWKSKNGRFTCWVKSDPSLKGEGNSVREADLELIEKIIETTGDFQPLLEYTPELPKSPFDALFTGVDLVTIEASNELTGAKDSANELFEGGICSQCNKRRKGSRTAHPLVVKNWPAKADGALVTVRPGRHVIPIYSQDFIDRLMPSEVDLRPVISEKASRRAFYEIECKQVLPVAFVKGIQQTGWCCDICNQTEPRAYQKYSESQINYFVAETALPIILPACVKVTMPSRDLFCIGRARWEQIAGKSGTNGLAAIPIGIVPASLVNATPKVDHVSEIIRKYGRF